MTTRKKTSPEKIVSKGAMVKFLSSNPGLASSATLATDSKPETSQGTTCHTNRIESSGVWLNIGWKFDADPWLAPAKANTTTRARKVNVVALLTCALA